MLAQQFSGGNARGYQRAPRGIRVVRAAPATTASEQELSQRVNLVKAGVVGAKLKPSEILKACLWIENQKLQPEGWNEIIGGKATPGNAWALKFSASQKVVTETRKGKMDGGGQYIPFTAAQRWDASKMELENGVFLGGLLNLTFEGQYTFQKRQLSFKFDKVHIRLGPKVFSINTNMGGDDRRKQPFFLFAYVDDDVLIARGRGGGIAVWTKLLPSELLKQGIQYNATQS